jgi:hypothetical protein
MAVDLYEHLLPWQTRVLKLLPGQFNDALECDLYIADVVGLQGFGLPNEERYQQYEALSYSWGYPDLTAPVVCNGITIHIPPTMAEALHYLRYSDRPRWLWCDAICINQQDATEKSNQVQIMMIIFAKASRVVAWLGLPESETDIAFRMIKDEFTEDIEDRHSEYGHFEAEGIDFCPEIKPPDDETSMQGLVRAYLQRPWFKRTWIRQEVFAAKDMVLQAGRHRTSLKGFYHFAQRHKRLSRQFKLLYRRYRAFDFQELNAWDMQVRSRYSSQESHENNKRHMVYAECVQILKEGSVFEASDNRDRIYGVLGLMNNLAKNHFEHLRIDYNQSVSEVYQDLTKYFINLSRSLRPIQFFRTSPPSRDIPTWAIDCRHDCSGLDNVIADRPSYEYEDDEERALPQDLDQKNLLLVRGFYMGTVDMRTKPMTGTNPTPAVASRHRRKHRSEESHLVEETWLHHHRDSGTQRQHAFDSLLKTHKYVKKAIRPATSAIQSWSSAGICVPSEGVLDGDWVVALEGSDLPFVLRPQSHDSQDPRLVQTTEAESKSRATTTTIPIHNWDPSPTQSASKSEKKRATVTLNLIATGWLWSSNYGDPNKGYDKSVLYNQSSDLRSWYGTEYAYGSRRASSAYLHYMEDVEATKRGEKKCFPTEEWTLI